MKLSVVKQSFFGRQGQYGRLVTRANKLKRNWTVLGLELGSLRRQLQRKRLFEKELCVRSSVLRFSHVGRIGQNRRSVLSLALHENLSC